MRETSLQRRWPHQSSQSVTASVGFKYEAGAVVFAALSHCVADGGLQEDQLRRLPGHDVSLGVHGVGIVDGAELKGRHYAHEDGEWDEDCEEHDL